MPTQKPTADDNPISRNIPRGQALTSYLSNVTKDVEQLERALQSLPRVDEKGSSDCPVAENLYAEKEELEAKLSSAAPALRAYLAGLQQECKRCQNNLNKIRAGAGQVSTSGVADALDSAAQAAEDAVYQATTDSNAVMLVLPRVEAALKVSRTKKYPGKEPRRQLFPSVPKPGGHAPN